MFLIFPDAFFFLSIFSLIFVQKISTMEIAALAPEPKSMDTRKLHLLMRIAQVDDEELIQYLEDILLEDIEDAEVATDEEIALVEARIAEFRTNPNDFVTLEAFAKQMKQGK